MTEDYDADVIEHELQNWGRHIHDGWLADHVLYATVPTSEQYVAPIVAHDDPEPARHPIDEQLAMQTERIVVHIGLECFTSFQALQHWYTLILRTPRYSDQANTGNAITRLSKKLHTSRSGAERILDEARYRYWLHRELKRLTRRKMYGS